MNLDTGTLSVILAVLLAMSEGLAAIPAVKSNAIYQLILKILQAISGKKSEQ